MGFAKRVFNIGLCAKLQNLSGNNKQIGGFNKVIVLCRPERIQNKCYFTANSILGDHLFREGVSLWRSKKFKTMAEAVGCLTKEVRIAQQRFPQIYFFKIHKYVDGEITAFDEFLDNDWIRSRYEWDWDPFNTMRGDMED